MEATIMAILFKVSNMVKVAISGQMAVSTPASGSEMRCQVLGVSNGPMVDISKESFRMA